ncbi:raftlin-like isoform X2 [Sinocyclocheilus anshuiensis]|uniref:raftlin-like isoform X2 n=1 Tax=Sinocyclocheilus anshuiensis TaxID=1608454 RepID=UPI0007B89158|nr:PREDICTED: raftlin-like isoform X2 [Sinocyclocheilus anshuiensis]
MGCGLRKFRQAEDNSPGKIYSTLKRPQVETKIGVAYTYHHLDFLVGKDDGTSTLCLSSVRELPSQLQDLYQQGFILAAVHPFVHPCGPEPTSVQRQLYRAVLIKVSDSWEKNPADFEPYHLKLEECMSADQIPTTEHIQGYVKKIQDAADQGIMFVGFIQEPAGLRPHVLRHREPEEPSLSLHSSPSSLHGSGLTPSPSPLEEPELGDEPGAENEGKNRGGEALREDVKATEGGDGGDDLSVETSAVLKSGSGETQQGDTVTHNNNDTAEITDTSEKPSRLALTKSGAELFGLFNYPGRREGQLKYYTVKVPLRVQPQGEGICTLEANWLDHMTQHFNNGASLVDGYFQLASDDDVLIKTVDSVFVFQEGVESDTNAAAAYDAIVVEQWTIIDGLQVKTDYIPLLQSLASFGWRLTCVLPTPIIKTNSDGSLATKQIVFLQRPVLPRKKKESKKVIFKARNKSNKNSVKDAPKNKKKKDSTSTVEKEISDQKQCDGAEKSAEETNTSVNERREENQNNEADAEVQSEQKEDREEGNETQEGRVGAGREKQEALAGNSERDGNAKDEVDVKEEERSVKAEAEMGSCQDKASPTAQETGRQDDEVDKQEDSSANQD